MKIKIFETWDLGTGIEWWDRNRERLNNVINAVNDWQTIDRFDEWEKKVVLARIESCIRYGEDNSFSDTQFEELDEMKEFVENVDYKKEE